MKSSPMFFQLDCVYFLYLWEDFFDCFILSVSAAFLMDHCLQEWLLFSMLCLPSGTWPMQLLLLFGVLFSRQPLTNIWFCWEPCSLAIDHCLNVLRLTLSNLWLSNPSCLPSAVCGEAVLIHVQCSSYSAQQDDIYVHLYRAQYNESCVELFNCWHPHM